MVRVSSRMRRSPSRAILTLAVCCARETARETLRPVHRDQTAGRGLKLGPVVVEVPAQIVDQPRPGGDEAFAVVDEQPNVELTPAR